MDDHLALVLEGGRARVDSPPLLIPCLALEQVGAQVEVVPYPDFRPPSLALEDAGPFDEFVIERLRERVASGTWRRITFIVKSLGTLVLARIPTLPELAAAHDIDVIWVTPLLGLDYVRNGVLDKGWRSLLVAGAADEYHDAAAHADVCRRLGAESLVIAGADHALIIDADPLRTIDGYRALAEAALAFARR